MHLCGFQVVVEGEEGAGVFFSHCEDGSILGGGQESRAYVPVLKKVWGKHVCVCVCGGCH